MNLIGAPREPLKTLEFLINEFKNERHGKWNIVSTWRSIIYQMKYLSINQNMLKIFWKDSIWILRHKASLCLYSLQSFIMLFYFIWISHFSNLEDCFKMNFYQGERPIKWIILIILGHMCIVLFSLSNRFFVPLGFPNKVFNETIL